MYNNAASSISSSTCCQRPIWTRRSRACTGHWKPLASDRVDESLNHLFEPLHPGVLRLIDQVIKAAAHTKVTVSMCGEMVGDPRYTPLLLAMGLREFSAPPASLLAVKQVIRQSHVGKLQKQLEKILYRDRPEQITKRLSQLQASAPPH
ncbi:MAG: hypothetical protein IBX49_01560 [Gammaproteobacteria bacterium]|nr:hypothetical protein [Gammaproteobacteria bacterium]